MTSNQVVGAFFARVCHHPSSPLFEPFQLPMSNYVSSSLRYYRLGNVLYLSILHLERIFLIALVEMC